MAADAGRPPAQVALAWASAKSGVSTPIIGARGLAQLRDNLASLEVRLTPAQFRALEEASAPEAAHPCAIFSPEANRMVFGGAGVAARSSRQ